jgi:hypothetical protein
MEVRLFMKRIVRSLLSYFVLAAFALIVFNASAQPVIINASFEADDVPPGAGYGAITGWTPGGAIGTSYGINGAGGVFADNGVIPDGTRVGFMQSSGTLSQVV